jgi:alpha-beta hydrolase superfamily lysophospholipase
MCTYIQKIKGFTALSIVILSLCSSCSGRKFFYAPNKNVIPVEVKNAHVKKMFLSNTKQKRIEVTHIEPNHVEPKATILIILPNGGNSSILIPLIEPLISDGYAVYLFDYEGYGKSEGKADNSNVLFDAQMVFDYVIENNPLNSKIIIWGFSLGGNLAVKLASDNPKQISALIIEAAFSSHRDIAKKFLPHGLKWISFLIKSPYPSREIIKNITVPVFIAHSTEDKVVPFEMGETLYANANFPKYFLNLSGTHCFGLKQETNLYLEKLNEFLIQNNIIRK